MTQNVSEAEIKRRVEDIRCYNNQLRKKVLIEHFTRTCSTLREDSVRADILKELEG